MMHDLGTAFSNSFDIILRQLDYKLTDRNLSELKPHFSEIYDIIKLSQSLSHLDIKTIQIKNNSLEKIDKRLAPFLIISNNNLFIYKKDGVIINCNTNKTASFEDIPKNYEAYCFKKLTETEAEPKNLVALLLQKYKKYYWQCLLISFFINILALASPIFIISIYNQIIGTYSLNLLWIYTIGIIVSLIGYGALYLVRSYILVELSSQADVFLGIQTIKHILNLPLQLIESSSTSNQMSRIQNFNSIREFLSSQAIIFCFDLPFTTIFLIAIATLGGWVVVFPATTCLFFTILFLSQWKQPLSSLEDKDTIAKYQLQQYEALKNFINIKHNNLTKRFYLKLKDYFATKIYKAVLNSVKVAKKSAFSDAIILLTSLLLLCFCAIQVMNGNLSSGSIIAIIILNWRVLGPFKGIYAYAGLIKHIHKSYNELLRLFQIKPENLEKNFLNYEKQTVSFLGNIKFNSVSFRYPGNEHVALNNLTYSFKAGEIIAIAGDSGSGKSTLLKLLMRLYAPSFGSISLDNKNITQIDAKILRENVSYVPQHFYFIYGTIAQNIRLSNPNASDSALWHCCELAGIAHEIRKFPDELNTRIHDQSLHKFSNNLLQGISLARAWLKHSRIILLDDPVAHLDDYQVYKFNQYISSVRGMATIIMVTHRPSIIRLANKVLLMSDGRLIKAGKPDAVLTQLLQE